ncbi:MAG: hypothetical protein ACIALR_14580 [Blastopirellula sp. JB062]
MTRTSPTQAAEPEVRLVSALPRVLLRMPDLAAPQRQATLPLPAADDVEEPSLMAAAPAAEPPKREYRLDAAHSQRAPHVPRRKAMAKEASAADSPDRSSPVQRKPLYDGAQGRRERMQAAKTPVWRTRLFLATVAAVLIWGTIQISVGRHSGKKDTPAAEAVEAPPFETDIQLGELRDAPSFGGLDNAPQLDANTNLTSPPATAALDAAPQLQSGGQTQAGADFNAFPEPQAEISPPSNRQSYASERASKPQHSSDPAFRSESLDLLGGGRSATEHVASRPGIETNRNASTAASGDGSGVDFDGQAQQGGVYGATKSQPSEADWWKDEPRDASGQSAEATKRPAFDGAMADDANRATSTLGAPQTAASEGSGRYGQSSQGSFQPFGGSSPSVGQKYYAPGDPAERRPAQARLNGYVEPTDSSRYR